jgi:hypothetical protein
MMEGNRDGLTRRERLLKHRSSLWADRSPWDAKALDLQRYVFPTGGRFHPSDRNRGETKHGFLLNNTPTVARRTLSAGLMAGATSPARPWFRLKTPDQELNGSDGVRRWLDDTSQLIRDIYSRSNYYRMLQMFYDEIAGFGTAVSIIYDDFETVQHAVPLTWGEYGIANTYKGRVGTLIREYPMSVEEMVDEFGYNACSVQVRNQYDRCNYYQKITVYHMIAPRRDRDRSRRDSANMPFASIHVEAGGDHGTVLRESGFTEFPVLGARWSRTAGDTYGYGPGDEVLGDAMELQDKELRKGQVLAYRANPPLQVPHALKNTLDILPGGVTYYDQATPHGGIRPAFEVELDYTGLLADIERTERRIDRTMYKDLFLMLATLDATTSHQMTAREVAERHEEKLLMLGPVMESLTDEVFAPSIDITFVKCVRAGIIPTPPRELVGQDLKIEFVSVLAQAQRAVGLQSVDRLLGTVGSVAAATGDVSVWDKIDRDRMVDMYSDMLGVDPDLIVSNDSVALIRGERQRAQQAANAVNSAESMANAAKAASETDTTGSNGLTDLMRSFSGYT